jgi:hypothetical protein
VSSPEVSVRAYDQDLTGISGDYASSAIDSILILAQLPQTSYQSSYSHLDRGRRLTILAGPIIPSDERADSLRCLSAISYTLAAKCWKEDDWRNCVKLAKQSCEAGVEALNLISTEEKARPEWKLLEDVLSRRFETLGLGYYKVQESTVSGQVCIHAF